LATVFSNEKIQSTSWKSAISLIVFLTYLRVISLHLIIISKRLMEIFNLPDDNISLPDENISPPVHGCHGHTGTSAWFFPFITDYLPLRTRG
jgi:hypothetical protein